jgi:RNA polymerase sigma factor (TIGR02999 family)
MTDVTRILNAIEQGDGKAADELLPLVYEELRLLAAQKIDQEKPGQTLQATALVHEAYIRLVEGASQDWNSRGHFFAAAAEAMRRILVENARRKQRFKHGGEHKRIEFEEADLRFDGAFDNIIVVDEALTKLKDIDQVKYNLVKLHFFAGLNIEQAGEILEISQSTAKRYWRYARAWLFREIRSSD